MYKNKQSGFTLVEMITVTVIIGILASVVISVINIPRIQARSRDSKRIADIKRVQTALELYFSDFRMYPSQDEWVGLSTLQTDLASHISDLPVDPRLGTPYNKTSCFGDVSVNYGYYYRSMSGGSYIIGAIMEVDGSSDNDRCGVTSVPNCSTYGCNDFAYCYCVQNPL